MLSFKPLAPRRRSIPTGALVSLDHTFRCIEGRGKPLLAVIDLPTQRRLFSTHPWDRVSVLAWCAAGGRFNLDETDFAPDGARTAAASAQELFTLSQEMQDAA